MVSEEFWADWEERFKNEAKQLITPDATAVRESASKITTTPSLSTQQRVDRVWRYIAENVSYKLSAEWKTPSETLAERIGDCEDVDFLFMSLAPHHGINRMELHIGYLSYPDKTREAHTWVVVGGEVIDPTAYPAEISGKRYETKRKMEVHVN